MLPYIATPKDFDRIETASDRSNITKPEMQPEIRYISGSFGLPDVLPFPTHRGLAETYAELCHTSAPEMLIEL